MLINQSVNKENVMHTYIMECYSGIKSNKIMAFAATLMELETIILSEVTREWKTEQRNDGRGCCHQAGSAAGAAHYMALVAAPFIQLGWEPRVPLQPSEPQLQTQVVLLHRVCRSPALLGGATVTQTAAVDPSLPVLLGEPGTGRICLPGCSCSCRTHGRTPGPPTPGSRQKRGTGGSPAPSELSGRELPGAAVANPPRHRTGASLQPAPLGDPRRTPHPRMLR